MITGPRALPKLCDEWPTGFCTFCLRPKKWVDRKTLYLSALGGIRTTFIAFITFFKREKKGEGGRVAEPWGHAAQYVG